MNDVRKLISNGTTYTGPVIRVLGIDLGTTNSTVAEIVYYPSSTSVPQVNCLDIDREVDDKQPANGRLVPSVVAIYNGETIVGAGAKRLIERSPDLHLERNRHLFFECKNDMGIKRTYYRAQKGFRSSPEIGGQVLSFLYHSALDKGVAPARTVITVPASFQSAQRNDTRKAAEIAEIPAGPGDLLDEPVAAFIDYLVSYANGDDLLSADRQNVLVFDFGGGTCDVAIFRLAQIPPERLPTIAPIAVSRYHRLGGGDIDSAILYDVLLPQFCEQNNLRMEDLEYDDKKARLEPCLKPAAEQLKILLCDRLREGVMEKEPVRMLAEYRCTVLGRRCTLKNPILSIEQFNRVLEPFIDHDSLCTHDTEYRLTCSIFAPIRDAIDRAELDKNDIDCVLLAGGSSLIPQVSEAVGRFFRNAKILTYPDPIAAQTTVARGAAFHSLALAVSGRPIIQPVSQDSVAIKTARGVIPIIPGGVNLPYPISGWGMVDDLIVPEQGVLDTLQLRIELVSGTEKRAVYAGVWNVEGLVNKGDPIRVRYRYDENQILNLELTIGDGVDHGKHAAMIENPLTQIINPNRTRIKILEVEEEIKAGDLTESQHTEKLQELAGLYAEIGQREKAIAFLRWALKCNGEADAGIINHIGLLYGELGNFANEEKLYRQAIAIDRMFTAPLFNMALMHKRQGKIEDALQCVDAAIEMDDDPPYQVLKAQLLQTLGRKSESRTVLEMALRMFDPVPNQNEWELNWLKRGAVILEKNDTVLEVEKELRKRNRMREETQVVGGVLPEQKA